MESSRSRVLVVDDQPDVAATLRDAVSDLGYAARVAINGAEALQLLPVYQPDVVLLDLSLPDMPGDVVLARLREADPHLPVIVVTGNTDLERARGMLTQGACDYIAKPFSLEVLGRAIAAAVIDRR